MDKWQELEARYYMRTTKRCPVTLVRGKGVRVWDSEGREYLDLVGGWAVNSLGHCHPALVRAISKQARTLIQASNQFYTTPQLELAELLIQNSCLARVFFCNSGAEANEGAAKLARRFGKLNLGGAYEIVTAYNSFHGRTLAMVAATGQHKFQDPYVPLPEGFVNVEYNSIEAIRRVTSAKTCAVMLEPIQGEGGVNVPADDYLGQVRAWCNEKGILFILDEVQTGLGRIGKLFGYQHYGVEPDVMTLAKGLGGGVPIGALLATERASVFVPGEHGSTFGGNPLTCAASVAVVRYILQHNVPAQVEAKGRHLLRELNHLRRQFDFISDIRGRGLLVALEFSSDIGAQITDACLSKGLLINNVKPNALRFIPALTITRAEIDEGLGILREVLGEWQAARK